MYLWSTNAHVPTQSQYVTVMVSPRPKHAAHQHVSNRFTWTIVIIHEVLMRAAGLSVPVAQRISVVDKEEFE
jgi:hypothetical protein